MSDLISADFAAAVAVSSAHWQNVREKYRARYAAIFENVLGDLLDCKVPEVRLTIDMFADISTDLSTQLHKNIFDELCGRYAHELEMAGYQAIVGGYESLNVGVTKETLFNPNYSRETAAIPCGFAGRAIASVAKWRDMANCEVRQIQDGLTLALQPLLQGTEHQVEFRMLPDTYKSKLSLTCFYHVAQAYQTMLESSGPFKMTVACGFVIVYVR